MYQLYRGTNVYIIDQCGSQMANVRHTSWNKKYVNVNFYALEKNFNVHKHILSIERENGSSFECMFWILTNHYWGFDISFLFTLT